MTSIDRAIGSAGVADVVGLRVATGTGRLARRPHALLFFPGRSDGDGSEIGGLVSAFEGSNEGDELRSLARSTVAAEFAVPAYVAAIWGSTITVMAFGDVSVQTDQPSLPLLAAGASSTWVEHTLFEPTERVTIDVEPPNDADTNLVAGQVPAGGFRLELVIGELPSEDSTPTDAVEKDLGPGAFIDGPVVPPSVPEPMAAMAVEAIGESGANGSTDARPQVSEDMGVRMPNEPAPLAPPDLPHAAALGEEQVVLRTDYTLPPSGLDDPKQMLAAIQGAAVGAEDEPIAPSSYVPDVNRSSEPAGVAAPNVLFDAPTGELGSPAEPVMVEGRCCELGHGSPPSLAACQVCGAMLHPTSSPIEQVRRPPLGDLILDDGTRFPLERDYVIGRRPGNDQGFVGIKIDGDKVSRQHLTLSLHDWSIVATDMGSTNGTYYLPTIGSELAQLADSPIELNVGAVLYVGSRTFTIEPHQSPT